MQKLRMNLDDLKVDQFQVEPAIRTARGTVLANGATTHWYTAPCLYCPNMPASARC